MSDRFTIEDLDNVLKIMMEPQQRIYNAVCFKCGKSFISYEHMNNFMECEKHQANEEYKMIKPLKHSG